MTKEKIFELAIQYMKNRGIDIILPGEIHKYSEGIVEVIFLDPMALEPGSIVCPPDNRVLVNTKTGEVTWVEQM